MKYWLIKSEGECYSIDDLQREQKTSWNGVRNYQARNYMRDQMRAGDLALFYHSNGTSKHPTGVYGIARVCSEPHPDESQFNTASDMDYEPRATHDKPIWVCVDFEFVQKFERPITLSEIKNDPTLTGIMVAQTGSRLSIQPVSENHFTYIVNVLAKF